MRYIYILLLFVANNVFPQYTPYIFPSTLEEDFLINPIAEYNKILKQNEQSIFSKNFVSRYAEDMAFGKAILFNEGDVYYKQTEIEDYLLKLFNKIMPENSELKASKIFLTRYTSPNAFVIYDGTIFVNIGLFAEVDNEASLCFVLAHEFAHYYFRDVQNSYAKLYNKNKNDNLTMLVNKAEFDRTNELRADSFAIEILKNNKFDLKSAAQIFYKMQMYDYMEDKKKLSDDIFYVDTNVVKSKNNSRIGILSSHPELIDRIKQFENHIDKSENKIIFLEKNEADFLKVKKYAIYESLNLMLHKNRFRDCVEFAFKNYLFYPDDEVLAYYLLESIRRRTYLYPKLKNSGFLTEDNYSEEFKNNKGILHNLSNIVFEEDLDKIKAKELLDKENIRFETYNEAFQFFASQQSHSNNPEIILTIGMHSEVDSVRSKYLNKYLNHQNSKYKEYAQSFLKNTLYVDLTGQKRLYLFDKLEHFKINDKERRTNYLTAHEITPEANTLLNNKFLPEVSNAEAVYLSIINANNFSSKTETRETAYKLFVIKLNNEEVKQSYYSKSVENKKQNPFEVFPEIWYYFKNNSLGKLNYVKVYGIEDYSSEVIPNKVELNAFIYDKEAGYTKFYNTNDIGKLSDNSVLRLVLRANKNF